MGLLFVYITDGSSKISCKEKDCLAIVSAQSPFKNEKFNAIEFRDPPKDIQAKMFDAPAHHYDDVKLHYSRRPGGTEITIVQTFKHKSDAQCGDAGIVTTESGFMRTSNKWQEIYTKEEVLEPIDLKNANLPRPQGFSGISATGDEVLFMDNKFIFLNQSSPSVIPMQLPPPS